MIGYFMLSQRKLLNYPKINCLKDKLKIKYKFVAGRGYRLFFGKQKQTNKKIDVKIAMRMNLQ